MAYQIIFNEHPYWDKDPKNAERVQSAITGIIEKENPILQEGDTFHRSINGQGFTFTCHLTQQESFVSGENYLILNLALSDHPA